MKAVAPIVIGLILLIAVACFLFIDFPGTPIKTVTTDRGGAGPFIIGETKEALLTRLPNEIYSPRPKPAECPKNWIEVSNMTATERQCLRSRDSWDEGISYFRGSCPENVDIDTTLDFKDDKLVRVTQVCRRPE